MAHAKRSPSLTGVVVGALLFFGIFVAVLDNLYCHADLVLHFRALEQVSSMARKMVCPSHLFRL